MVPDVRRFLQQDKPDEVFSTHRHLQAGHSEQEFRHGLLVGRGIALCVYVRRQTLLVI